MKKYLSIAIAALFLSGCASIVRDSYQSVPVQADMDNVDIEITNSQGALVYKGQAPTTVMLKTSKSGYFSPEKYTLKASKPGYGTRYQSIDWHVSNWYIFGNLVFGGLLGWFVVDPLTGDMYYLDEVASVNLLNK